MKKAVIFLLIFLSSNLFSQDARFEAWIEQNNNKLAVSDKTIHLKKAKFKLVIKFFNSINYIMVNLSDNSKLFDVVNNSGNVEDVLSIDGRGMAEYDLNPDKDLWITDLGYHYLYYSNDKENRFDEVIKTDESIICKRTVEKVEYIDTTKKVYRISKFPENELYLVFVSFNWGQGYTYTIKQTDCLKLVFD